MGTLASTKKACPDMALADEFRKLMAKVKEYQLNDLRLILLDGNGQKLMKFKKVD